MCEDARLLTFIRGYRASHWILGELGAWSSIEQLNK